MSLTTALVLSVGFMLPPTPTQTKNFLKEFPLAWDFDLQPRTSETENYLWATTESATAAPASVHLSNLDPFEAIEAELQSYMELTPGWDGEGSHGATWEAVVTASRLLQALPAGAPLPKPMLSASGEIGFYWNTEGAFVDAMIEEDNTISLFSKIRGDQTEEKYIEGLDFENNGIEVINEYLGAVRKV
ncbi:hypothetical protein HTY52_17905 [Cupriavidus taiwanensis]|uniref:hypothetical protein n=1 Tax=Cupriavidus taiwanensis TaxID=164546 RepID=UPI001573E481|nr:hypothetical protein [Cupriavidus taiwanensis]NSX15961.1 hypothetical protein [Cupriavidus taiwanensis]